MQLDFGLPEIIVIAYYTDNDMSLGSYLETKCFSDAAAEEFMQVRRYYTHDSGKVTVTVDKLFQKDVPPQQQSDTVIRTWSYCKKCGRVVTPVVPLGESSRKYSFGKFLETTLYNHELVCRTGGCNHSIHRDHIRCYGYRNLVAKFEYSHVDVYDVVVPQLRLQYDPQLQLQRFADMLYGVADVCTRACNDACMVLQDM